MLFIPRSSSLSKMNKCLLALAFLVIFHHANANKMPDGDVVTLEEYFPYSDGLLTELLASNWRRGQGAPIIEVRGKHAFIPGEAKSEAYVTRRISQNPPGSASLSATFQLRIDPRDGAPEPCSGIIFQFTSSDGRQRRGRLAIRVNQDGSCNLGITAKYSNSINWASHEVTYFEDHLIGVSYDYSTGCASLWIDSNGEGVAPAAQATDTDSVNTPQVSLQQCGKKGAPDVRISELSVKLVPYIASASVISKTVHEPSASAPIQPRIVPPSKNFMVFLLIGQSNMAGRGLLDEVDAIPNPNILKQNADGSWSSAKDPLHWDKPRVAGVGPGLAFAQELLPKLPRGYTVGLIPAAFGGTKIAWWQKNYKGDQHWPTGESYYNHALQAAKNVPPGSLAGALWIQGESDINLGRDNEGEAYRNNLHILIQDLRSDLKQPELPFVVATLGPWHGDNAKVINGIYLSLPQEVKYTAVVSTMSPEIVHLLHNKSDDPPHYDSASARLLGRHFAQAIMPFLEVSNR